MLNDFLKINTFALNENEIIINLLVALVCGLILTWFYRKSYSGPGYAPSFLKALVLLSMITALVIMVIGNNLARAFGLVGAMSIIRFRTAVKDIIDIVYIFFSLAVGMASGVGYYKIAITGTVSIGVISYLLMLFKVGQHYQKEYLLQFTFRGNEEKNKINHSDIIKKYSRKFKLINIKMIDEQELLEMSYYVKLKTGISLPQFTRELKSVEGVENINIYTDDEQY